MALSSEPIYVQRFQIQREQPKQNTHSSPQANDMVFWGDYVGAFMSILSSSAGWCGGEEEVEERE